MDYLNSLKQLTENFLSDYFDKDKEEDKNVKESLGIGAKQTNAPTAEVQVEQLADNKNVGGTSKVVANALATAYDNDDGEYETEEYDYQIQSGDTLTQIARRANMTIKQLLKLNEDNPAIKTKDLIYAGGNIKLSRPVKTKEDIINFDTKPPAILTKESNVDRILYEMSEKYNLPYELVKAVGIKESGLNPFTVAGDAGTALGLMQVRGLALKDVNQEYGLNITREQQNPKSKEYDIRKSIESGVAYLALQRDRYGADPTDYYRMLAQYNGGPTGLKKAQAKKYAESVLNTMKTVKPFDFDADTMRGDRTPPSEKDSFAVEMDNLSNEVEASGVAGVDFKLLKSATDYVKGVSLDNLLVSKADAMFVNPADIEGLKLTDTTKNEIQSTIKEIDEIEQKNLSSMETKLQLREKLDNLKVAIENMSTNLGEVKDQTLQAMGSGGSAQSGMLGFSGQGEFRPNVDLSFLNPFKKDDSVEEKTVDEKVGREVDVDKAVAAGFPVSIGNLLNRYESSGEKDEVSNAFFNEIKGKVVQGIADASRKTTYKLLPSNFANLFSDVVLKNMMGLPVQTSYVTEKDFSASEFATVKNAAVTALNKGKMNIDYEDYGENSRGVKASQLVGSDKSGVYEGATGYAKFIKDLFADPTTIMTYTLGGASIRIDENDNVIVTDQYDAEKFKYGSANPGLYGKARDFLQKYLTLEDPNIKGENPNAIRFEINLGKKEDLLKTKGLMEKS